MNRNWIRKQGIPNIEIITYRYFFHPYNRAGFNFEESMKFDPVSILTDDIIQKSKFSYFSEAIFNYRR